MLSTEFSTAARQCEVNDFSFSRVSQGCLAYTKTHGTIKTVKLYDFIERGVTTVVEVARGNDTSHLHHFSEVDAETLHYMREKLIELGGTPPPLPQSITRSHVLGKHKGQN